MVEYTVSYNDVFQALADETRRDILRRIVDGEKTITEIAKKYSMSFAAVAKHITVLESAALITKRKQGRAQVLTANQQTIASATDYLKQYESMWHERFNTLEEILKEGK